MKENIEQQLRAAGAVLPRLYKTDSKGVTRFWCREVEGNRYRTVAGMIGTDNPTTSEWTTCEAKYVGKSNEVSAEDQCWREVAADYTKKLGKHYVWDQDTLVGQTKLEPMAAEKWDEFLIRQAKKPTDFFPVFVQPKLDGMRCLATKDGLISRGNKPIVTCPHIEEELKEFFARHPDKVLDGELYNHALCDNFDKLMSLLRKQNPTAEHLAESKEKIQFHIYDVVDDGQYEDRFAFLNSNVVWSSSLIRVDTRLAYCVDKVDQLHKEFVAIGYEGAMVRLRGAGYQQKRVWDLLKYKVFLDDEFEVVAITEGTGNWAGHAKTVEFKLPDDWPHGDSAGTTSSAGIKGNKEQAKKLLVDADKLVGTDVTIRYFNPTPKGKPRKATAQHFHYGKRSD